MFDIVMFFIIGISFNVPTIYWLIFWIYTTIQLIYVFYKCVGQDLILKYYRNKIRKTGRA